MRHRSIGGDGECMSSPLERRSHPRAPRERTLVAVAVRTRHLAPGTRVPGRLTDLSAGGFSFIPAAPFAPGDLVRITMVFDDGTAAIGQEAVVVRHGAGEDGTATTACRFVTSQQWVDDVVRKVA
jgi:hypothetical protein